MSIGRPIEETVSQSSPLAAGFSRYTRQVVLPAITFCRLEQLRRVQPSSDVPTIASFLSEAPPCKCLDQNQKDFHSNRPSSKASGIRGRLSSRVHWRFQSAPASPRPQATSPHNTSFLHRDAPAFGSTGRRRRVRGRDATILRIRGQPGTILHISENGAGPQFCLGYKHCFSAAVRKSSTNTPEVSFQRPVSCFDFPSKHR